MISHYIKIKNDSDFRTYKFQMIDDVPCIKIFWQYTWFCHHPTAGGSQAEEEFR